MVIDREEQKDPVWRGIIIIIIRNDNNNKLSWWLCGFKLGFLFGCPEVRNPG
jgi:hypothetical protein